MNFESRIGFMQGRLIRSIGNQIQSFPKDYWQNEFSLAENIGFRKMEWVFDDYDNPILAKNEHKKINSLCNDHQIRISSICADFFMVHKLFSESSSELDNNFLILENIIEKSTQMDIKIIEIPLVDSSSIKLESNRTQFSRNFEKIIPFAEKNGIILNLETDLPPNEFKELITDFSSKFVRANYDIGNSISLGYNIENELIILDDLISNVHVKDRLIGGRTVPLGDGDVDFELFFKTLAGIGYTGDFIIQGARENENLISTVETCRKYFKFVKNHLDKYFNI